MNRIKKIRKIGLWVIVAVTMIALFAMNVAQRTQWAETVAVWAIGLLVVWMVAMGIVGSCISHRKKAE